MDFQIMFANSDAEEELRGIFLDSDMDIAGDIQEHVLIRKDDEIIGGGMLAQTDDKVFHLLVFAVKESARKHGIGRLLIEELLRQPWQYCIDSSAVLEKNHKVTTVAKGQSAEFYKKVGFVPCDFSDLAQPFHEQCLECPELDDCNPVAMVYAA
ncbi:MAG: GNAT family N-acetyltransferase [Desulfuromonadaceae bacterium]|nr:GNAT family N-acetyltransferase [Desulfuromonadaceae bacterium]MDD2849031.1 GNAT family N-acetyltransferase [Desulfuromonadaceae bacterium]MDD4131812.1 GNAT family N-acetyltransferase [Desulfuromonadaceae bacterium]